MFKQATKTVALAFGFEINVMMFYGKHQVKPVECSLETRKACLESHSCQAVSEVRNLIYVASEQCLCL